MSNSVINRRGVLKGLATGAGAVLGASVLPETVRAANAQRVGIPRRVVFFLQNQGFDPATAIPAGMTEDCSLAGVPLPEPMRPLQGYTDRMHIINGLHGRHTSPSHSAFFGAMGGYRGGIGIAPAGPTIDHILSGLLPQTILPHLCIGMDSIENMRSRPTLATLSATGAGRPIFMHSNPVDLYRTLFGGIATGDVKRKFEARSRVFDEIEALAGRAGRSLPAADAERFGSYTGGFREMNGLREKLVGVADHLRKFAPDYGRKFTHPEFETDWHDSLLEIGIATLKSGLTNVLTIGSGRGEIFGAWKGLGVTETGHNLGHMKQPDNDIWIKIRQYNSRMLARLIDELESMPEPDGAGTMMDNTVIVYSSNNADKQHSNGANWPFVLIGSRKGVIQTGRFTQLDGRRPVNALYTTLLHAIGKPADRFNMDKGTAAKLDSKVGPIESLLA